MLVCNTGITLNVKQNTNHVSMDIVGQNEAVFSSNCIKKKKKKKKKIKKGYVDLTNLQEEEMNVNAGKNH